MFEGVKNLLRGNRAEKPALRSTPDQVSKRMFAAAQYNRLVDWPLSHMRINGDLFMEYTTIVLRARDLAQNNEHVIGILRNLQRNVIGVTGFTLQSKSSNLQLRSDIEAAWRDYCSRVGGFVTLDEHSSARDLDILVLRSLVIDGECFLRKTFDPFSRYGWRYEVIDSLQIDPMYTVESAAGGNRIYMGIELDSRGREVAYYYRPTVDEAYYTGPRERLDAANVIHIYRKEFPAQIRGISMLAGAVLDLRQLDDYRTAELVHARIGSAVMGVWEWNGKDSDDIISEDENDPGEFAREIRPGIFPIAPRGYQAKFLQGAQPNNQFGVFVKSVMRSIANSLGISYNKASGDYESVNYSSLREAALEDRETFCELQKFMIENWKTLQYIDFVKAAVLLGRIRVPRGIESLSDLVRHQFFGRRFAWIDPQKEIAAKKEEIALMLTDPISELEARGEDPEEVVNRFDEWKKLLAKKGVLDFWLSAFDKLPDLVSAEAEEDGDDTPPELSTNQPRAQAQLSAP